MIAQYIGTEDQAAVVRRLSGEVERLTHELDKAHRLLSQSVGWQHDAEIVKVKQAAEIGRLLVRESKAWAEHDALKAEIERLRGERRVIPGTNIPDAGTPSY